MAREEHPREDLLREATALVERLELLPENGDASIVVGFHQEGAASFYFGEDPVYHFNSAGELRRAYVKGKLYKADQRHLVELTRLRTPQQTQLVRDPLSPNETAAFLAAARQNLSRLASHLATHSFSLRGEVPQGANVVERVKSLLEKLPDQLLIAASPHCR